MIEEGIKVADGNTKEVIDRYISKLQDIMKKVKYQKTEQSRGKKEKIVYDYQDNDTEADKWKDYRNEMLKTMKITRNIKMKNLEPSDDLGAEPKSNSVGGYKNINDIIKI